MKEEIFSTFLKKKDIRRKQIIPYNLKLWFVFRNGCIEAVGDARAIREQLSGATFDKIIDCSGKCILPG